MSTLELYIWENRVIEVVMFIVKNMQIGIKLAGIIFSDNLIIETRREWEFEYCSRLALSSWVRSERRLTETP